MTPGRYTLINAAGQTLTLSGDAVVTAGNGVQLAYTLARAVDSDEWEEFGDGKAVPQALVLEWDLKGISESDASVQVTSMWALVQTIVRVERDSRVERLIRKPLGYELTSITPRLHHITLRLLPRTATWRSISDQTVRAL